MEKAAPSISPLEGIEKSFTLVVVNKVKDMLAKRGTTTIRGMHTVFQLLEGDAKARKADKAAFIEGLAALGVTLAKPEMDVIACLTN
jgi:hypothetical protein